MTKVTVWHLGSLPTSIRESAELRTGAPDNNRVLAHTWLFLDADRANDFAKQIRRQWGLKARSENVKKCIKRELWAYET